MISARVAVPRGVVRSDHARVWPDSRPVRLARAGGRLGVGLLAALLLVGCVSVAEYRNLERRVDQLQGGEAQLSGTRGQDAARMAELGAELDDLRRELGGVKGELEELRHSTDQMRAQLQNGPSGPARPASADEAPLPVPATAESRQEVSEYEAAFRRYREGDYGGAIDRFQAFLQNHPSSDYADNALFWQGESYFRVGDYERAVLTFEEVTTRYPDGNKVPDALYRQGIALMELGSRDGQLRTYTPAAQEIFERIVTDYPESERVPEARRQLEKLSQ